MSSFCTTVLESLQPPPCVTSVAFVGATCMRALNRRYRGRNYATDVLSFPYPGESLEGDGLLGEVVVCPEVALAQAQRWNTSFETEIRRLLVHGLLHLLGHDHETDDGEMLRLQRKLLQRRPVLAGARLTGGVRQS